MHFSNRFWTSNPIPIKFPDYAKERFIQAILFYLSDQSISSIIDVYLQLDLFLCFFVYILHLQLVVLIFLGARHTISIPRSTRLYYCIINGAKLLNFSDLSYFKSTSTRPRRIDYRIVEKNTISVCKFFRSYDSLSRKRIK